MSIEIKPKRVAGQHVRAEAKRRSRLRFLGGSFKRDHGAWAQGAEGEEVVGEILEGLVGSVPAKRRGVTIVPARMLAGYFVRRRPLMSVEQADSIYDRLCLAVGQPPSR